MAHRYFEILGLSEDASTEDVKSAYRRLAHRYHPDHCRGDSQKFRAVQEAYDALIDSEQRRRYTQQGDGESIPVRVVRRGNGARGRGGTDSSAVRGDPLRPERGYYRTSRPGWDVESQDDLFRSRDFTHFHTEIEALFNRILRSFFS